MIDTLKPGDRVIVRFDRVYFHPAADHAATVDAVVSLPAVGDFVNVTLDEAHAHFGARIFNVDPADLAVA